MSYNMEKRTLTYALNWLKTKKARFGRDRIRIESSSKIAAHVLDLIESLGVGLSVEASQTSLRRLHSATRRMNISLAVITLGVFFTLISVLYFFLILYSETNSGSSDLFKRFLLTIGIFVTAILGGYFTLRIERSGSQNPLHSIGHNVLASADMDKTWDMFCEWARSEGLIPYLKQANEEFSAVCPTIWHKTYAKAFVLGTGAHRRALADARIINFSQLVILKSDWQRFLEFKEAPVNLETPDEGVITPAAKPLSADIMEIGQAEINAPVLNESLSLRQKIKRKGTGWSPRHELCRRDNQYLRRYLTLGISEAAMRKSDLVYHRVILFFEENFDSLHLLNGGTTKVEKIAAEELISSLRKILVKTDSDKPTVLSDIKLMTWAAFEKYLERSGLITDAELAQNFPLIRDYLDSDNI